MSVKGQAAPAERTSLAFDDEEENTHTPPAASTQRRHEPPAEELREVPLEEAIPVDDEDPDEAEARRLEAELEERRRTLAQRRALKSAPAPAPAASAEDEARRQRERQQREAFEAEQERLAEESRQRTEQRRAEEERLVHDRSEHVQEAEIVHTPERPAASTGQAVAVRQETGVAVAAPRTGAVGNSQALRELAEEEGMEGLETGFRSFQQLVLDKGKFVLDASSNIGTQFQAVILGSKSKWIYKNVTAAKNGSRVTKEEEDFVYSYDQVHDTTGEPLETTFADWRKHGWDYEEKKYLDVQAQITSMPGKKEAEGALVILSISPSSLERFGGHCATMRAMGKRLKEYQTIFTVGPEIKGKSGDNFNPWQFAIGARYVPPAVD